MNLTASGANAVRIGRRKEKLKMPQVGDTHFPYNAGGRKAAEDLAARTGQPLVKGYSKGRVVEAVDNETLTQTPMGCTVAAGYEYDTVG